MRRRASGLGRAITSCRPPPVCVRARTNWNPCLIAYLRRLVENMPNLWASSEMGMRSFIPDHIARHKQRCNSIALCYTQSLFVLLCELYKIRNSRKRNGLLDYIRYRFFDPWTKKNPLIRVNQRAL